MKLKEYLDPTNLDETMVTKDSSKLQDDMINFFKKNGYHAKQRVDLNRPGAVRWTVQKDAESFNVTIEGA